MKISNEVKYGRVGYCHCNAHKGYLTKKSLCEHKCLERHCPFMQKFNNQYWKTRDAQENRRQIRRFYAKHKSNMLVSMDEFLYAIKEFYGSYNSVPQSKDGKVNIKDLLKEMVERGEYIF